MNALASGLGMGVGRFSRTQRGVGVITMRNAGLDTMRCVEIPRGAGVLRLVVPGVPHRVFVDCRCEADRVEVPR
jgi:hypothetical protein